MIPWLYKNKYYIIDCCYYKISISNLLEDECYANFSLNLLKFGFCCGYICNDNYLCVSDYTKNCIRMWDLVNKEICKEIEYEGRFGYGIIPWNNKYTILGCESGIVIIDVEKEKMIKKIELDNTEVKGVKKLKIDGLGECLIVSDNKYNIKLYRI